MLVDLDSNLLLVLLPPVSTVGVVSVQLWVCVSSISGWVSVVTGECVSLVTGECVSVVTGE